MKTKVITVKVQQDSDPQNPREDCDHYSVFAGWHRRYRIGDVQPREAPLDWFKENAPKGSVVLGVGMYDHSGVRYYSWVLGEERVTHDQWDGGQVGFIVATPDAIRKAFNVKRITKELREKIATYLKGEIETYDAWARGDVWGYVVEDGGYEGSCWGFYGDDALEGMKAHVPDELHPALMEAWDARFNSGGGVGEVELPDPEGQVKDDADEATRERVRDMLTGYGLEIGNNCRTHAENDVERVQGGAWVTVDVFLPDEVA